MIRKLAKSIKQYKRAAILAPVFMVFEVFMEIIIPRLMANMIDSGINADNMGYVLRLGAVLLAAAFMALGFGVASGTFAARAAAGFARNLRRDIYSNIQTFSFSNLDKFSASSLITRMTTDIMNVQNAFQMIIRMAVRAPVMLILSFFMAFSLNKDLSMIFLVTLPILAIILFSIIRVVHPIFVRVFQTYDKLNKVVQENLRGIRVVKSYVREDFERGKFQGISDNIYKEFSKAEKIVAFNMPIMQFFIYATMLLLAWFGARMIVGGVFTTGELMSFFTYAMQIMMSLMMLSMIFVMIIISRASAERIVEVLSEQSNLANSPNPLYSVKDGSIRFKNVDFSYAGNPNKLCLSGVDLDIKSGETIGILGGTGSAKSTLVQLIPRLYDVTAGSVTVGGEDVRNIDIETLRNDVAVVLQKNLLFSGTIKENLRWGSPNASDEEMIRACKLAQADEFIQGFPDKYDTYIEQGGANVSGGQKQRLCIARALLKKPKILILDDSTSAVDTQTDALIRKAFREEIPHTTKLIIAQRVASVQDADKIIVMDNGKIHAVGAHEELLESDPIYREVFYSQTKGSGDFDL